MLIWLLKKDHLLEELKVQVVGEEKNQNAQAPKEQNQKGQAVRTTLIWMKPHK